MVSNTKAGVYWAFAGPPINLKMESFRILTNRSDCGKSSREEPPSHNREKIHVDPLVYLR